MRSIRVERSVATAVRPSPRVLETAAMFGLGVDDQRTLQLVPPCEIPLPQGAVVFVTGPSGGGKSTILALIGEQCEMNSVGVIRFDQQAALLNQLMASLLLSLHRVARHRFMLMGLVQRKIALAILIPLNGMSPQEILATVQA